MEHSSDSAKTIREEDLIQGEVSDLSLPDMTQNGQARKQLLEAQIAVTGNANIQRLLNSIGSSPQIANLLKMKVVEAIDPQLGFAQFDEAIELLSKIDRKLDPSSKIKSAIKLAKEIQ